MKKLIKYFLIAIGILLLLIIAAVIVLPYVLNVDALVEYGEDKASAVLGREVTIEDASFSWAGPKINLAGFSIEEAEGWGEKPFAKFDSFDLKLRLIDLFRLRLSVEYVVLSGPKIRILKGQEGRFNFDDILENINQPTEVASLPYPAMDPSAEGIKTPPLDFLVNEIRVKSGQVYYSDAGNKRLAQGITIEGMEMSLKDLSLDRPVKMSALLGIGASSEDIVLNGTVGPVGKIIVPGNIPFDMDLEIKPFELSRVTRIIGPLPVSLSGVLSASESVKGSLSQGIAFSADARLDKLNVNGSDNRPLVKDFVGSIVQKGRLEPGSMNVTLESFTLEAYQAVFDAEGTVKDLGSAPKVDLMVKSNPIPLAGWDEVLPDLGPMITLDGDLTFEGNVTGTVNRDLKADLVFRSKRFEIDRGPALLERSSSKAIAPPVDSKPLEPIKAPPITVTGEIAIENGRFERIAFTNMSAKISQKESLFSLDELRLEAFAGRLAGSAWADLGALPLTYGTKMMMTGVQINDALAAVADMDGILFGKATMDIALDGRGTEFADLQKYLSGRGAVKAEDGRITTANLGDGAAKAASLLGLEGDGGDTRFEDMNVSFTVEKGKIKVSNMRLATGEYSLKTRGDIGLDKSLDLTSRMTLSKEKTDRIPVNRRKLFPREPDGRVRIPLKIGGSVTSPRIGLDSSAMDDAARKEVKKEIEEKKEELKEQLQKDLGDKLKKLIR